MLEPRFPAVHRSSITSELVRVRVHIPAKPHTARRSYFAFSSHRRSSEITTFHWKRGPGLQGLVPAGLRWSWCDNRSNACSKCNAHVSFQTITPSTRGKIVFHEITPGANNAGDRCFRTFLQNQCISFVISSYQSQNDGFCSHHQGNSMLTQQYDLIIIRVCSIHKSQTVCML